MAPNDHEYHVGMIAGLKRVLNDYFDEATTEMNKDH